MIFSNRFEGRDRLVRHNLANRRPIKNKMKTAPISTKLFPYMPSTDASENRLRNFHINFY